MQLPRSIPDVRDELALGIYHSKQFRLGLASEIVDEYDRAAAWYFGRDTVAVPANRADAIVGHCCGDPFAEIRKSQRLGLPRDNSTLREELPRLIALGAPAKLARATLSHDALKLTDSDVHLPWRLTPKLELNRSYFDQSSLAYFCERSVDIRGDSDERGMEIRTLAGAVAVQVSDSGPGISPEARERLFEPFFTTKKAGTGLGLAVSRALVRAQGGDLEACSATKRGACFVLRLPAAGSS